MTYVENLWATESRVSNREPMLPQHRYVMGWVVPLGTVVFVQRAKNIALSLVDLGPVYMEVGNPRQVR